MKAAAIIAALGIALIFTMGPAPASAQTTVIRECGGQYTVTHYNSDGSVKGVHNKQLSDAGTIYTAGKTWKLVEGSPDRFVGAGGAQLQVIACDTTPGSGTRGIGVQQAQTSSTLISNLGQDDAANAATFNIDTAQGFTTGGDAEGYKLTSVKISMVAFGGNQPDYKVEIWSGLGGSGTKLGELNKPDSLSTTFTVESFSANGDGIDLAANSTYWVVIDVVTNQPSASIKLTDSDSEDAGGAAGWTINNDLRHRSVGDTVWNATHADAMKINVIGYAKPASLVSAEVTGTTLVLTYDNGLDTTSRTAARQFGIKFGGGALRRATAISIGGRQVTLTVPEVRAGQVVTVSYTVPTSNPLKGSNGAKIDAFTNQPVTVNTGPAFGRLPASGKVRDAVYITADNGEVSELKAYSADRETLWDYFESECRRLRSVSDPYRDYSLFDADGRRIQASNGWKYVYVQNSQGDVTGTRAMYISECASNKVYQRQAFCNNYTVGQLAPSNEDNVCPDDRSW